MSLEERRRPAEPNHIRTYEVQTLDTLLRIEETLTSILEGLRHFAKQRAGIDSTPATETPAQKNPELAKGKRK